MNYLPATLEMTIAVIIQRHAMGLPGLTLTEAPCCIIGLVPCLSGNLLETHPMDSSSVVSCPETPVV
jgi:hypothetical protein